MDHHLLEHHETGAKNNHATQWIIGCLAVGIALILAIRVFNISVNSIAYFVVLLACPLMHLWMTKSGGHKH
jgi:hypothetical protein